MSVYIWSDLHLGHKKIIDYEKRPFSSVEEMTAVLMTAWRETVSKEDIIINLGDVALYLNKEKLGNIIRSLPGYKILILGNHDRRKSVKWWMEVGFDEVYKYPIIYDDFYILSHYSIYINASMPYVNIHGHSHTESTTNPQKVNVSVECINYKPILFDSIKDRFDSESFIDKKDRNNN